MAKTRSLLHLYGTINGLTFYAYRGRPCVRRKSSLDKERLETDPVFKTSQRVAGHFGDGAKAASIFRHAISPFAKAFSNGTLHNRLTTLFAKKFRANPEIFSGDSIDWHALEDALQGFEFRADTHFDRLVRFRQALCKFDGQKGFHFEAESRQGPFMKAFTGTHFRVHLVLTALHAQGTERKVTPDMDFADEGTWSSHWLPAYSGFALVHDLFVPDFLQKGCPIAVMMVVEPGVEIGSGFASALTGRCMKLLCIL